MSKPEGESPGSLNVVDTTARKAGPGVCEGQLQLGGGYRIGYDGGIVAFHYGREVSAECKGTRGTPR